GAEKISRRRAMILTDGDLFPPGTIQLNGVKVFGEDLSRVSSYAASMARAADCGLQRLFDGLLRSEG
ncbi:Cellulose biosynthesis protein BcsF, partial [Dysosmobacter welbionis]